MYVTVVVCLDSRSILPNNYKMSQFIVGIFLAGKGYHFIPIHSAKISSCSSLRFCSDSNMAMQGLAWSFIEPIKDFYWLNNSQ